MSNNDQINLDVDDLFKQTVFKLVNKNFEIDFPNEQTFPTELEFFESFSKNVSDSFARQLQQEFYDALVEKFQKQNL